MEKIKKIPKIYWLLLMVTIIGGAGIFGNYDDNGLIVGGGIESASIGSVLKFFRDFNLADKYETLLPGVIILYIPFIAIVLGAYLFLGLGTVGQLKELAIIDTYKFIPYFQIATLIFGVIAVYVFYKICLEVFKRERTSLIASYLLATSLIFTQQLHASAWMLQTMVILISIYYSLLLLKKEKWRIWDFIISALLIIWAVEIETVGLIAIVPFFLVCWQRRRDMKISRWVLNLFLFFSPIILGIVFFAYLNPVTFRLYFSLFNKSSQLGLGETYYGLDIWGRFLDSFRILILLEPLLFVLALFGVIAAFWKNKFLLQFFGLYAFLYYLVLGPLLGGMAERRLLPIIPAFTAFAAFFINFLFEKYNSHCARKIIYCGLLLFLVGPLIFNILFIRKGSATEARNWIYQNIPENSSILDKCRLELNENKEILNEIAQNYPSFFTTKRKYLLDNPSILASRKGYFVRTDDIVNNSDDKKIKYLIICYFNNKEKIEALKFSRTIEKINLYNSAVTSINLFSLTYPPDLKKPGLSGLFSALFNIPYFGPNIEIYELKPAP